MFLRRYFFGLFLISVAITACGGGGSEPVGGENGEPPVDVQTPDPEDVPTPDPIGEVIPDSEKRVIPTEESRAFIADAPYASVLAECALANYEDPCQLGTLPYIGQENLSPSIDDIMQRVVVTHDWMGVRFREMLERLPSDILPMFAPVTSVVIGSEVRPSSFWVAQGRMMLDPRTLWLSVDEKRTVATNQDPRTDFGSDLQFVSLTRFMIGDNYAWGFWSLTDNSTRTHDDIELPLASLLYHELAHANDFIQPDKIATFSDDLTPWEAFLTVEDSLIARQLYDNESLTAQLSYLYGLADVRYFDSEATEFQKSLQADFVGAEMGGEGKLIFYSYATALEDVAMLVEGAMMKYHYGVDVHTGFANKPQGADISCNDYKVAWGVRNRVASDLVVPRAQFVLDRMLPSVPVDNFLASAAGNAAPLREGDGWCDSRFQTPASGRTISSGEEQQWDMFQRSMEGHVPGMQTQ